MGGLTAACFQPMYGDYSYQGGGSNLREKLASVDVLPLQGAPGSI
jgi:hypothetical protein